MLRLGGGPCKMPLVPMPGEHRSIGPGFAGAKTGWLWLKLIKVELGHLDQCCRRMGGGVCLCVLVSVGVSRDLDKESEERRERQKKLPEPRQEPKIAMTRVRGAARQSLHAGTFQAGGRTGTSKY